MGVDKGQLDQHADHVHADPQHVPATVATVRVGQRRNVVTFLVDEVVIHQVDRAPGGEERQQEQDEVLERVEERVLPQQCQRGGRRDDQQHKQHALAGAEFQAAAKATDDGGDAHEAAVGVEGGHRDLAEHNAQVQQGRDHTATAQTDNGRHFVPTEIRPGQCGGEHPQHHRSLSPQHGAEAHGGEGFPR
ncbi:hypothetical protein D3C80_1412950 [compost metagenome]